MPVCDVSDFNAVFDQRGLKRVAASCQKPDEIVLPVCGDVCAFINLPAVTEHPVFWDICGDAGMVGDQLRIGAARVTDLKDRAGSQGLPERTRCSSRWYTPNTDLCARAA